MNAARFELNPQVLHETIDGEVIVIDLATGTYYSLRGSAADVWQLLAQAPGVTTPQIAEALVAHYEAGDGDVEADLSRFVGQLVDERLVNRVEAVGDAGVPVPVPERNGQAPRAFEPPALEKYTDMQELVLLDPVHEVDQTGWPRVPDPAPDRPGA